MWCATEAALLMKIAPETILLFLILTVVFKILPGDVCYPFLLSPKAESNWQFYCFTIVIRFLLAGLALMLAVKSDIFEGNLWRLFAYITIGKNIDFALSGNSFYYVEWFTFNTMSLVVFILYESGRQWKLSLSHGLY